MNATALRVIRIAAWIAIGVVAGFLIWTFVAPRGQNPAQGIAISTIGGPFSLTDQRGTTVTEAALKGHPSLLFFGYTYCPDVCPTTLADMSVWLQQLGPYGDRLKAFFVSIDPARDTQMALAEYLKAFDPRIQGLTGSQEAVDQIVKNYRVFVRRVPGQGSDYTFDHTAFVYLLDANGAVTGTITTDEDPVIAYEKIRRLVGIAIS
jgi:protein SCO1/2